MLIIVSNSNIDFIIHYTLLYLRKWKEFINKFFNLLDKEDLLQESFSVLFQFIKFLTVPLHDFLHSHKKSFLLLYNI